MGVGDEHGDTHDDAKEGQPGIGWAPTNRGNCSKRQFVAIRCLTPLMPPTRATKKSKSAEELPGSQAVDFNSLNLKIEADNKMAIRLFGDLIDVLSVAEHTRKIFGVEEVGKALRKLAPIEGIPEIPSPLEPSSFSHEVWFKILHAFTKACVGIPGLKMGTFRTCKTHEGTRSTVLRWAAMLAAWKPRPPMSGQVMDLPGVMPLGAAASAARISSLEVMMAEMANTLKALVAQGVSKAAQEVPLGVSIDSVEEVEKVATGVVGSKRTRGVSWNDEITALLSETEDEGDEVVNVPGMPVDPAAGGAASKGAQPKPGAQTPPRRDQLNSLLLQVISPQQKQLQDQLAQADKFAEAEASVGLCIDKKSLKAIYEGNLANVQLGHFAPSSGNLAAMNAAAERQGTWFSFSEGKFEANTTEKFKFADMLQFIAAFSNFVKAWCVIRPDTNLHSLFGLKELFTEWAHHNAAPLSILVELWVEHKRVVGSRRNTVPPFDWLNGGADLMRLQFRLQTVVQHQWLSQRSSAAEKDAGRPGGAKVERSRVVTEGDAPTLSGRQVKKAKKAERAAVKVENGTMVKRDTSKEVCKFGATCREFLKSGNCGYLHRS